MRTLYSAIFAFALIVYAGTAAAIPNPTLHWKTIATEHFEVHYHEGTEWTARQVAQVAEEIYPHITGLYDYDPGVCHFVILDTDDYANGAAYFYDNKIEIWATNLEFGFRGTTQWIRNVVTHEYVHIVSIGAAMKMPRSIPAIYFQWINFEDEKRPDVITGYPNAIASYPYVGAVIPPWWAEGTAQYMAPGKQYDCWDAHRDMILRSGVLDDKMLSYDEMGFLGHRSIGNEMVYDHGYGLVRYIAMTYGPNALEQITEKLGRFNRLTIDGALESVTGKSGSELYGDWVRYLRARYEKQLAPVYANPREGLVVNDDGFMTISPAYSPDGKRMTFLSNKGSDYAATTLFLADGEGKDPEGIGPASSAGVFSPDGKRVVFGRHGRVDKYGAVVSDLYEYDIADDDERRLTHGARAAEPSYSPDGRSIVCVLNSDGTHRLAVVDAQEGGEPGVIFARGKGTQLYRPMFSADGSRILFGIFTGETRDIASIASDGTDFRYVVRTLNDERDPAWGDDGRSVYFSSERNGIYNLYRVDLATAAVVQLTNVVGGAFTPSPSPVDNRVAYSGYNADGYNVSVLGAQAAPVETMPMAEYAVRTAAPYDECRDLREHAGVPSPPDYPVPSAGAGAPGVVAQVPALDRSATTAGAVSPADTPQPGAGTATAAPANAARASDGDDDAATTGIASGNEPLEPTDYKRTYTDWQVFPRVVVWDGVLRMGAFVASNEILDKQAFFASGSYGLDGGFDALISFEMRRFWPVLFLEYYRLRQKYDDQADLEFGPNTYRYFLDIRYDLWSIDGGLRFEMSELYNLFHRHHLRLWYSHSEYRVNIDPEFVDENGVVRPDQSVGWKYFVGNEFYLQWDFKGIRRALDSDINPRGGREISVRLMYAVDDLFTSGEFEYGFRPQFDTNKFGQYTVDYREFIPLPFGRHTLQLRGMASYIDNRVDDFFWVYMGGMDRARGYTYYTLGGRAGALASATWRFPIWRRINRQMSWLTFKDIYGALFFEIANAWDDEGFETQGYKRTAGYELRFNLGSYYAYPTAISFTGAYGMDRAVFLNPLFPENSVVNDPRWRYYFTMGFQF